MFKTYFLKLEADEMICEDQVLLSAISKERAERAMRYKEVSDIKLSVYSALLVRYALLNELKTDNKDLEFSVDENARPVLISCGHTGIDFNYSHTRGAVLLGITDKGRIGVDIERIDRRIPYNIGKKVFNKKELEYIERQETDKELRFLECWTRKEAYTKMKGHGLSVQLTDINTFDIERAESLSTFRVDDHICSVSLDYAHHKDSLNTDNDILHNKNGINTDNDIIRNKNGISIDNDIICNRDGINTDNDILYITEKELRMYFMLG